MRIKYIYLGFTLSGGLYGGYKFRKNTIESYEKRGYKNIPNNVLIVPTIFGTIVGLGAFPILNSILVIDLIHTGIEKYFKWGENQLKKANPDSSKDSKIN